jgi:hypothetical protein
LNGDLEWLIGVTVRDWTFGFWREWWGCGFIGFFFIERGF